MATFIFWLEALCVVSAIEFAASLSIPPSRLAIFTNNLDTVQIFDSLRATSTYNPILHFCCQLLIHSTISLCVFHVPGEGNVVADALSCSLFAVASQHQPCLQLFSFTPPVLLLGGSMSPP